jgi:heme/copper-type cytochrome/quinol oxidase subunit 4
LILEIARNTTEGCGIPVIPFLEVFFIAVCIQGIIGLVYLIILRRCYSSRFIFKIVMAIIFLIIIVAIIIWGYIIYFSEENDCQDHPD